MRIQRGGVLSDPPKLPPDHSAHHEHGKAAMICRKNGFIVSTDSEILK
jgi:hypothetical protein